MVSVPAEDDLVVPDPEVLGEGTQPGDRRLSRARLPVRDLLGRHADGLRQLQVRLTPRLAQGPDRLHQASSCSRRLSWASCTRVSFSARRARASRSLASVTTSWAWLTRAMAALTRAV